MKPWLRYALTFGVAAAIVTLLLNLVGNATATGDACHRSSPMGQLAFLIFLGLMGGAGFLTARAGGTVGQATLSGLGGAIISAVGTVIALAIIVGSIPSTCVVTNANTSVSSGALTAIGIVGGLVISVIGLGVGAGAGAIGGLIGRRPAATTV